MKWGKSNRQYGRKQLYSLKNRQLYFVSISSSQLYSWCLLLVSLYKKSRMNDHKENALLSFPLFPCNKTQCTTASKTFPFVVINLIRYHFVLFAIYIQLHTYHMQSFLYSFSFISLNKWNLRNRREVEREEEDKTSTKISIRNFIYVYTSVYVSKHFLDGFLFNYNVHIQFIHINIKESCCVLYHMIENCKILRIFRVLLTYIVLYQEVKCNRSFIYS